MKENTVDIITMGCSKNLVDSEALMGLFEANGFKCTHDSKNPKGEIAVVNTCGFIQDAKEESINTILELAQAKEEGRLRKLYVMGCLSQRYLKELAEEIPQVDKYYGKFDYNDVRQALFVKVLEKDLIRYQELLLSLGVRDGVYDNLLNLKSEMEEILSLSRKKEVVTDSKEEDSSDKSREFDEVINKAKEIISSEKELIDSVKPEDLQKFLIDSVTSDDKDNKYKIVSILMELSREVNGALDKVKLFDGHLDDSVLSSFINNINKYIETYEVLKGDRNEENKEEHVIYLESIVDEVNALDKKELNAFKKVCEKLILGDFSEVKRLENTSYNIYVSSYKDVNVSFMRLPDKFLMILHVYTNEDVFGDMDEMFIKEVLLDKEKVFASQSELRGNLKIAINRSA